MSMALTQPEAMSVTQRCSWKGSMSTIMNHRVSVGWGGVREEGTPWEGAQKSVSERVREAVLHVWSCSSHVISPSADPSSPHYMQKRLSTFL